MRVLVIIIFILVAPFSYACTNDREVIPDGIIKVEISQNSVRPDISNNVWHIKITADEKYKSFTATRLRISTYEKPYFEIPVNFQTAYEKISANVYLSDEILNKAELYIGYGGFPCISAEKAIKLKPNKPIKQD
ncbi:hypothetical protein [Colwellia sp. E2M01]|uniref:hypothetical protein n=1 Tax=Colwellia sp. E2M01 TaxID=2841561 RepID=UPI001C09A80B|nr:hypothetical protein [Colwellia sp. E2M01]MBU2872092.1 hypothetical protein [Colwellia sp. E2M01]